MTPLSVRVFLVLLLGLAGCSSEAGPRIAPPMSVPDTSVSHARNTLNLIIPKLGRVGYATRTIVEKSKRRTFVSPSSKSIVISINGIVATAQDLTALNPNCTTLSNGDLSCAIGLSPPLGNDLFAIALWDSSAASAQTSVGNVLSEANFNFNVDGTAQSLNVSLAGVVRAVKLTTSQDYIPLVRTALTTPEIIQLGVLAFDADGNLITDPSGNAADYHAPIVISDRDMSGTTLLQTTVGASPPTMTGGSRSVSVANGQTNVYALYFGGFIRADAFDPSSIDVVDPARLQPIGLAFDCKGSSGKLASITKKMPTLGRAFQALPAAVVAHGMRTELAGGLRGISYDGAILSGCTMPGIAYSCDIAPLAAGECVYMPASYDDGNPVDTLDWNASGGILQVQFSPAVTLSAAQTCVEVYAPPAVGGVGNVIQINASQPWVAGTRLNNPLIDINYAVQSALNVDPAQYKIERKDCTF